VSFYLACLLLFHVPASPRVRLTLWECVLPFPIALSCMIGTLTNCFTAGCVTRDPRKVERKKPGHVKARKMPTWVKR
jgi:hypothetical protein